MEEERERLFSRLATVPGIQPMPSIGRWILVRLDEPSDLARKVNRRLEPGVVSVPRNISGAIRVPVRLPRENEQLFQVLRQLMEERVGAHVFRATDVDDISEAEAI